MTTAATLGDHPLERFFWPRSVAILGASPDPHRIRGQLLNLLRRNGYDGRILPVNPSYAEIDGLACHPNLAAIAGPIDLAVLAIPAAGVGDAVEACAGAGVANVVIISSGFAEEGRAAGGLQQR